MLARDCAVSAGVQKGSGQTVKASCPDHLDHMSNLSILI